MALKNKSKEKGGSFERKIAKELSEWMFNDPHTLKREPTSGASKAVYLGDIFPFKQIEWEYWPFYIECKVGYLDKLPTLLNFSIIEKWFIKILEELTVFDDTEQKIILLIYNPTGRKGTLLCTNVTLNNLFCKCVLCIKYNKNTEYIYCYDYKEVLKYDFVDLFSGGDSGEE